MIKENIHCCESEILVNSPKIDILLSTYNGEIFLQELFDSISEQTENKWRLIIRDDGSSDETLRIIEEYAMREPRVVISPSSGENLGVVGSFIRLLDQSAAPYFAFCDQDDYWLPHKLKSLLEAVESEDESRPILVSTDLVVVDAQLVEIFPSFMDQQQFNPESGTVWPHNLLQNTVVGCASMGNASLRSLTLCNPPDSWSDVIMHDWWLSLIASRFGRTIYHPVCTVLYRQHAKNQLGAKGTGLSRYLKALGSERPLAKVKLYLERASLQARTFQQAFSNRLDGKDNDLLEDMSKLGKSHGLYRSRLLIKCYRNKVRMQSKGRDILVLGASIFG